MAYCRIVFQEMTWIIKEMKNIVTFKSYVQIQNMGKLCFGNTSAFSFGNIRFGGVQKPVYEV